LFTASQFNKNGNYSSLGYSRFSVPENCCLFVLVVGTATVTDVDFVPAGCLGVAFFWLRYVLPGRANILDIYYFSWVFLLVE